MFNSAEAMESTRRLFIGGLCGNIKENELRERFESFGQVSSVEIVCRKDEQGIPIKTFAYVDLGVTDIQLKKCISLLNNTKWKGNVMKVQQAKENFLLRLNREWKENETAQPEGIKHKSSAPEDVIPAVLPGAVPGTPVPGKRNWVVGKFSRVLPVVYLRRRDNRKVAKFDPSKTAHNIKRLRCEEAKVPCAELTWNLDSGDVMKSHLSNRADRDRHQANGCSKYDKHREVPSSSGLVFTAQSSDVANKTERPVEICCDNGTESLDKRTREKLAKKQKNHDSFSADTKENSSKRFLSNDFEEKIWQKNDKNSQSCVIDSKLSKQQNKVLKKQVNGNKEQYNNEESSDSISSSTSLPDDGSDIEIDITDKVKSTEMSVSSASDNSLVSEDENDVENSITTSNNTKTDVENGIFTRTTRVKWNASDSSSSSDEESGFENGFVTRQISNENTTEENKRKQQILDDREKQSPIDTYNSEEDKLKRMSVSINQTNGNAHSSNEARFMVDSSNKQLSSNKRRLDAMQERNKAASSRKSVVHLALQNLESNSPKQNLGRNHIVLKGDPLDDQLDETSRENVDNAEASHPRITKISGSQAASWLGFNSDDSDEDSKGGSDEVVSVRPHFEGRAGEKLFRLQKSFGRDQRFQMDKRFLDSDEDSDDEQVEAFVKQSKEDVDGGDAITKQLADERSRSLAVLQKVLGRNVNLRADAASTEVERTNREFGFLHYDPTREDHKQFEEKQTKSKNHQESESDEPMETEKEVKANEPQVTTDRFYNVNTSSLADLFGQKTRITSENSTHFTFLPREEAADSIELSLKPLEDGQMETLGPRPWATQMLPYDSSTDESDEEGADDNGSDDVIENKKKIIPKDELFFFHVEDPNLANRLDDEDAVFMRTESQEELTRHWETVRSELTREYKKKHKDAKRRQNKIAARRSDRWTS